MQDAKPLSGQGQDRQSSRPLTRAGDSGTGVPISHLDFKLDTGTLIEADEKAAQEQEHGEDEESDDFSGENPKVSSAI